MPKQAKTAAIFCHLSAPTTRCEWSAKEDKKWPCSEPAMTFMLHMHSNISVIMFLYVGLYLQDAT